MQSRLPVAPCARPDMSILVLDCLVIILFVELDRFLSFIRFMLSVKHGKSAVLL